MAFCTNCGTKFAPESNFCSKCGKPNPNAAMEQRLAATERQREERRAALARGKQSVIIMYGLTKKELARAKKLKRQFDKRVFK